MRVLVNEEDLPKIEKVLEEQDREALKDRWGRYHSASYSNKKGKARIEISKFAPSSLEGLRDFLDSKATAGDRSAGISRSQVIQWIELKKDPGGQTVTKLESVESAMREYIGTSEHRYVFELRQDGFFLPWFVTNISYESAREYCPAKVVIVLASNESMSRRNSGRDSKSIQIMADNFKKRTMSQILEHFGYFLETPERMASYEDEVNRWFEYERRDGFQMSVTGKALIMGGWYDRGYRPVGSDGMPAKMVVDPAGSEASEQIMVEAKIWDDREDADEKDPLLWRLPYHPVIQMFDLAEHVNYIVHINAMEPYKYDKNVGSKLVLPADIKDFTETLIEFSGEVFEDIVSGKSGGTIVLIEGQPGIGKTLTAEVYSEVMERPLYKVQSSQLGTSPKQLEEELGTVLKRASRWGAILLIDEADVYIHERGQDIVQNAVVGVFLRVLEYYRGVLFMTTNRGTMVDDAIISRLTARLSYDLPDVDQQQKLWKVLAEQNGVTLSDQMVEQLVKELPDLSGRDIKNLLKLGIVVARKRKGELTVEDLKFVNRFRQSKR